jgi:hypothetical protein
MALYIYKRYEISPGYWRQTHWVTDVHKAFQTFISGSISEVEYDDDTIVDVYQKSSTEVAIVFYNSSYDDGTQADYPRLFLNEIIVSGNSGDTKNTLLFKRCSVGSPPAFEFGIYSHTTKDVTIYSYPIAQAPFCSALSIDTETVIQSYCTGTTLNQVYYDGEDGVTVEQTSNSATCGYVTPAPDTTITETKRIKIDHSCYNNPVYLKWRNTLGGWDQWLFSGTQTDNLITEEIGEFQEPVWDIETAEKTSESLGMNAGKTLILGADNLTLNQYNAIREILYSPKVYKIETDETKQVVRVNKGTFNTETKNGLHSIEFEIILPDINTVKN